VVVRTWCDSHRVRLCICDGKEACVLRAGLFHPVDVLPWDVQTKDISSAEGCQVLRPTQVISLG
jgi:hypothetical protein